MVVPIVLVFVLVLVFILFLVLTVFVLVVLVGGVLVSPLVVSWLSYVFPCLCW